jgi:hypothetical protein
MVRVLTVDTKKKELVGNYKNGGSDYRPKGDPVRVKVHDFEDKEKGKVAPYGVYDVTANEGFVSVAVTADTAEFAVQSIRTWRERMGLVRYPGMNALTITAEKRHAPPVAAETWGRAPVQRIALIVGLSLDFNSANVYAVRLRVHRPAYLPAKANARSCAIRPRTAQRASQLPFSAASAAENHPNFGVIEKEEDVRQSVAPITFLGYGIGRLGTTGGFGSNGPRDFASVAKGYRCRGGCARGLWTGAPRAKRGIVARPFHVSEALVALDERPAAVIFGIRRRRYQYSRNRDDCRCGKGELLHDCFPHFKVASHICKTKFAPKKFPVPRKNLLSQGEFRSAMEL